MSPVTTDVFKLETENSNLQVNSDQIRLAVDGLLEQTEELSVIQGALDCLRRPEFQFLAPLAPLFHNLALIPTIKEKVKVLQECVNENNLLLKKNTEV